MYLQEIIVSVCILFAASEALPTVNNLPNELVKWNTTSRYKLITYDKKSWFGALHACHAVGLKMASIHSEEDQYSFDNLTLSTGLNKVWWTAGNSFDKENSFFWSSNGSPFTYTRWATDYPKQIIDRRCVMVTSTYPGDWFNGECAYETYFLCQD